MSLKQLKDTIDYKLTNVLTDHGVHDILDADGTADLVHDIKELFSSYIPKKKEVESNTEWEQDLMDWGFNAALEELKKKISE